MCPQNADKVVRVDKSTRRKSTGVRAPLVHSSNFFQYFLYADDINLVTSSPNLHELIFQFKAELNKVCNWFNFNHSVSKSNCKIFRTRFQTPPDTPPFVMGGVEIKSVSCCRFLEVHINELFRFDAHIQFVAKKVSNYISILYKIRKFFERISLFLIFFLVIFPNITFCKSAWETLEYPS